MKAKAQRAEMADDGTLHVEPEGGIRNERWNDHELSVNCWCHPIVEQQDGRRRIAQHLPPPQPAKED